uniref:Uncharacterized protein n=1 Tax=Glossina palpalis gambiensis TaxID=67801 RepID=A0A1B0BB83_9MUSC
MSLPMRKESRNDKVKASFKNIINAVHKCSVHRTTTTHVYQHQALTLVESYPSLHRYHYGLCVYWWMLMLMLMLMSDENDSEADDIMR